LGAASSQVVPGFWYVTGRAGEDLCELGGSAQCRHERRILGDSRCSACCAVFFPSPQHVQFVRPCTWHGWGLPLTQFINGPFLLLRLALEPWSKHVAVNIGTEKSHGLIFPGVCSIRRFLVLLNKAGENGVGWKRKGGAGGRKRRPY